MACKYLIGLSNLKYETEKEVVIETFSDKKACIAHSDQCPKQRIKLFISPHCWRFKHE